MTSALMLSAIAMVEAVVYLVRIRTAAGRSHWRSAASNCSVTFVRIVFLIAGVSAVMKDVHPALLIVAYCVPSTIMTFVLHRWLERSQGWRYRRVSARPTSARNAKCGSAEFSVMSAE